MRQVVAGWCVAFLVVVNAQDGQWVAWNEQQGCEEVVPLGYVNHDVPLLPNYQKPLISGTWSVQTRRRRRRWRI